MTSNPPAFEWLDGDPRMEAIAAAVWDHCRTEGTSLIVDDPRNIAAVAAAVTRAAVPAVFPEPPSRAAVLLEAAEALGRMDYDTDSNDYGYDTYRDAWNGGVMDAAAVLRRVADEEQPAEAQPQPETEAPWVVHKICCGHDDGKTEFTTWEAADSFREVYIDSARIADHERSAVIRRSDAPAPVEPAAADSEETRS